MSHLKRGKLRLPLDVRVPYRGNILSTCLEAVSQAGEHHRDCLLLDYKHLAQHSKPFYSILLTNMHVLLIESNSHLLKRATKASLHKALNLTLHANLP